MHLVNMCYEGWDSKVAYKWWLGLGDGRRVSGKFFGGEGRIVFFFFFLRPVVPNSC